MRTQRWLILMVLFIIGCDPPWSLEDLEITDVDGTAVVTGKVKMVDDYGSSLGLDIQIKYFDDGYETRITEDELTGLGRELEVGESEAFESSPYSTTFTTAGGDYSRICAKIMAEESNVSSWTKVGCATGAQTSDDQNSSETGTSTDTDCILESDCCRVCHEGKACGDSCIPRSATCNQPNGCACNGWEIC